MDTQHYTVRQAMEMTGVKAYVLRYWEEELNLKIHRNELGHRYYTGYDIQLFLNIKERKKQGYQLRAIRDMISEMGWNRLESEKQETDTQNALEKAEKGTIQAMPKEAQDGKIMEFQSILERLITQELQAKNDEEERCRSLDLAIRKQQLARREAAAAGTKKQMRKQKYV